MANTAAASAITNQRNSMPGARKSTTRRLRVSPCLPRLTAIRRKHSTGSFTSAIMPIQLARCYPPPGPTALRASARTSSATCRENRGQQSNARPGQDDQDRPPCRARCFCATRLRRRRGILRPGRPGRHTQLYSRPPMPFRRAGPDGSWRRVWSAENAAEPWSRSDPPAPSTSPAST